MLRAIGEFISTLFGMVVCAFRGHGPWQKIGAYRYCVNCGHFENLPEYAQGLDSGKENYL